MGSVACTRAAFTCGLALEGMVPGPYAGASQRMLSALTLLRPVSMA